MLRHVTSSDVLKSSHALVSLSILKTRYPLISLERQKFVSKQGRWISAQIVAMSKRNESAEERAARKAVVKEQKAEKKRRREGHVDDAYGQKPCTLCHQPKDLLIRCQIDKTEAWHMVCGKCWNTVSGGVVDGDDSHPDYKKNLHKQDKARTSPPKSASPTSSS